MKSKDIRELALRLYNDGCSGNEIHRSLRGLISRRTIFYGLKLLKVTGAIALQDPSGCPRLIRSKDLIQKPSKKLNVSRSTIRPIIKDDLGYKAYVKLWARKNIGKSMTKQILFSDEKRIDFGGIYNRQNEKIYAATRDEADEKGAVHHKAKFPAGVMVWVEVCSQGITRPVIIENGTIDSARYIADILPVELKDGTQMLGNEFIFQQDGAKPHTAKNT
ncbi:unnamed protein product [Rotaria socialis]|uniref:Uncharacterized protein n=1 Tax=Rotaria socialis TaxID=392032 RepID=A0A821X578_9BILA|nr:unnamed protein product [Rotaria socialis]